MTRSASPLTLTALDGHGAPPEPVTITRADVLAELAHLQRARATWAAVDERPQPGDVYHVTTVISGCAAAGSAPQTYTAHRSYRRDDGHDLAPHVEALAVTLAPGETTTADLTWPMDFNCTAHRGVTMRVTATMHGVEREILPTLDDAFARSLPPARDPGDLGWAPNMAALWRQAKRRVIAHRMELARAAAELALIDRLADANAVDAPADLVAEGMAEQPVEHQDDPAVHAQIVQRVRRDRCHGGVFHAHRAFANSDDVVRHIARHATTRKTTSKKLRAEMGPEGLAALITSLTHHRVRRWTDAVNGAPAVVDHAGEWER